ncbi:hypothetical protein [Pedobacter sp. UYP1]|jgi:hypothetical protein|uniref:DUF6630 family protein n=1 Tax=Pedobacter sp. UYP1 TaxID=1756396 RepID=UPI0033993664
MNQIELIQQLSEILLSPDHHGIEAEIILSYRKPDDYLQLFKQELLLRGIESKIPELPLIALVNGLQRRNKLVEMDWKEDFSSFINEIYSILPDNEIGRSAKKALIDLSVDDDDDPDGFLPEISALLNEHSLLLIMLDIDSDSYPLIILSKAEYSNLQEPNQNGFLKKM